VQEIRETDRLVLAPSPAGGNIGRPARCQHSGQAAHGLDDGGILVGEPAAGPFLGARPPGAHLSASFLALDYVKNLQSDGTGQRATAIGCAVGARSAVRVGAPSPRRADGESAARDLAIEMPSGQGTSRPPPPSRCAGSFGSVRCGNWPHCTLVHEQQEFLFIATAGVSRAGIRRGGTTPPPPECPHHDGVRSQARARRASLRGRVGTCRKPAPLGSNLS